MLAWTGDRLFVYGGTPVPRDGQGRRALLPLDDAALIDPATGEVDVVADPPFERALRPSAAAAVVDDDVLLVGPMCREAEEEGRACPGGGYRAAVYSRIEDAWRGVDMPTPLRTISNGQSEMVGVTSDGRVVLLLGGRGGFGALASRQLWTYSPRDDAWESLPAPGSLIEAACLAGDVVIVGSSLVAETAGEGPGAQGPTLRALGLDVGNRVWFPTAGAGVVPTGDTARLTCGQSTVLVGDGGEALRLYELGADGGWRMPAPQPGDDVHSSRLWTGDEFLFLDANAPTLAYDPDADAWRGIEASAPSGIRPVWTGDAVVAWPGRTDQPVQFEVDGG